MSALGQKQTSAWRSLTSAYPQKQTSARWQCLLCAESGHAPKAETQLNVRQDGPTFIRRFCGVRHRNKIIRHETERRLPMRGRILRSVVDATFAGFIAILVLAAVSEPIGALTNGPSTPSEEKKQTDQDRCKFLMENVNATILSLNTEGEITFLNRYGQRFFGYSS